MAPCSNGIDSGRRKCVSCRHEDEFREAAIAMLADHLAGDAELFDAFPAVVALSAGDEVVQADAVALAMLRDAGTDFGDDARHFVPERAGMAGGRDARAVMRVRVADTRRLDSHEDFAGTRRRRIERLIDQRPARRGQANGAELFHGRILVNRRGQSLY